jgi:hypothetical protein
MHLADLAVLTYDQECDTSPASVVVSGTVAGFDLGADPGYGVWLGDRVTGAVENLERYALATHPGQRDLVASRGLYVANRLLVIRDLTVSSDTMQPVDFDSPAAVLLVPQPVTVTAHAGYLSNAYFSAGGTAVNLGAYQDFVLAVPASAMGEGDLQRVEALSGVGHGYGQISTTQRISRAPTSTIELVDPIFEHPIVTGVSRNGVVDLHATWTPQADAVVYDLYAGKWSVHGSPAALEMSGISVPDLSAVAAWDPSLALLPVMTDWAMTVTTGVPLDDALRTLPIHEGEIRRSGWTGFVGP